MSEDQQQGVDKELDELLDSSAKQFADRPMKNTDDELDELMAVADQQAAQKAASEFQAMLSQIVDFQEKQLLESKEKEASEQSTSKDDEDAANAMIEAMKSLMNCTGKVANASNEQEFEEGLNMLRSPESNMEPFMQMIMESLISKEVMYPPLKEIFDKYPAYLEENKAKLSEEDNQRFEKQFEVLGRLCAEFEKMPDAPIVSQDSAENTGIPAAEADRPVENFDQLALLLVELQSYGYPPKELTGELPEGVTIDTETGLPSFGQAPSSDACSIM